MQAVVSSMWDIARHATIALPAIELLLLLFLMSCCLVMRYNKLGLILAYLFSYKWGWTLFVGVHNQQQLLAYMIFGMLVGVLAMVGMLRSPK